VNILKFFKPDAGEVYRENARLKKMIEEYAKAARHSNKVEGIKRHSDNLIIKQIEKLSATVQYYKELVAILNRKQRVSREIQLEYEPIIDRQRKQVSILSKTIDDMSKKSKLAAGRNPS